ncbi:DExH-box ATP-dependent RNA helicase DExH6 [Euphorbia peplus]|nr:DExH-box ATP-dependent RNA helicase DExH6 [Euphorbia peplus]
MAKRKKQKDPAVDESTRIRISQCINNFLETSDQVYTFDANLENHERAVVHILCRKLGMKSKSTGRGDQRQVSIYKTKKYARNEKDKLTCLTFSEESRSVLQDLFANYPPEDGELGEKPLAIHKGKGTKREMKKDDMFNMPSMTKEDIAKKVEALNLRIENNAKLRQIVEERSKLPIASFVDVITSTISSHQVVLISGETGCGKTTQVPQFLLDHMWGRGEACKIVCTQPRRISATSVAERISCERGESIGDDIGYKIRLESKGGRNSSIVFCTNGVLLRVLVSKGLTGSKSKASTKTTKNDLSSITHIIVDEIHERDRYSDFMLAIIRDMLPSNPHLRLVLMSATLDAERFSQYFGGCPVICVPGFTYPVKSFYLEDVLSLVKGEEDNDHSNSALQTKTVYELTEEDRAALDEAINLAWTDDEFDSLLDLVSSEGIPNIYNYQESLTGRTPLMVFSGKGRVNDVCKLLSFGADCHLRDKDGLTALEWAERENQQGSADAIRQHLASSMSGSPKQKLLDKYLAMANPEVIDVVLIHQLLMKICADSAAGAILVFLPGWDDINRTREKLFANPIFRDNSKYTIISLHSMVPPAEQKHVFRQSPQGCRKIILSTNLAETAVTINDVVYVIDSGKMKEKSYDPYNNVSTLHSSWVSKASSRQRAGRAGRCQPGICYRLYSKLRAESLPDFQVPEIKRMPIEELCLQVKLLDPYCKIGDFLRKTLDPPVSETIRNAIAVLQDIGALSQDEELTEIGEKLGQLPVHPTTSKMLFFAILMNCLDPALTLACASDYRDPFTLPMLPHEKIRATAAKFELASIYGGHSDQLAVIAAFEGWSSSKEKGQDARFCSQYFISSTTMRMLDGMRKQLKSELIRNGFIPEDVSCCNLNSHDPGILRAVLVAGLYPMVGRVMPPNGKRNIVETPSGAKVRLHPRSLNSRLSSKICNDHPLMVYDEITRGDGGVNIRKCTIVGPLPLLLLATEIVVAPGSDSDEEDDEDEDEDDDDGDDDEMDIEELDGRKGKKMMSSPDNSVQVVMDRWLFFRSKALDVAQIYCLRERLTAAILFKVTHPRKELTPMLGASMRATALVLSWDGQSGIPVSSESVDSLTSMVLATGIDNSSAQGSTRMAQNSNSFPKSPTGKPFKGKPKENRQKFANNSGSSAPRGDGTKHQHGGAPKPSRRYNLRPRSKNTKNSSCP